jgi:large subunit ribosomal protein L4e
MAARPLVTLQRLTADQPKKQLAIPAVFLAPIRPDIVHYVHTNMAKNKRQPYAVSDWAGHQHSAESWGTGRAVARIPRVSGSGTSRAAQGAFGNMCRKGRMFAPTKTWRKWHRKINTNQKRYAVVSALAASGLPALVMARGHRIGRVNELPLVLPDSVQSITKTKKAVEVLSKARAYKDCEKAKFSKKLRAGIGKLRNRRYVNRRGPLIVFNKDQGIAKAFRNLPGVELVHVERLNLLQLAPGGHLGRFIVWTESAFKRLDSIWGTTRRASSVKKNYKLPVNMVTNSDITRIINSDEVQSKLRPARHHVRRYRQKKNPLKNLGVMVRLNPYSLAARRAEILAQQRRKKATAAKKEAAAKLAAAGQKPKSSLTTAQRKICKLRHKRQFATFKRISAA